MTTEPMPKHLDVWCRDCYRPATVLEDGVPLCAEHARFVAPPTITATERDEIFRRELSGPERCADCGHAADDHDRRGDNSCNLCRCGARCDGCGEPADFLCTLPDGTVYVLCGFEMIRARDIMGKYLGDRRPFEIEELPGRTDAVRRGRG